MFRKILIANRGEIAVRIIRACRDMGISPVGVFSEIDVEALHVRLSDEAICIGPASSAESYLNIGAIVSASLRVGADAVHPGYGFLAENADFARDVASAGLAFIGPHPSAIEAMGSKTSARRIAIAAGVPIVPGTTEPLASFDDAKNTSEAIGYPVMLKASAGGGGKGMRLVRSAPELREAFEGAQSEAEAAFASSEIYLEKVIERPRHIEIQLFADTHGNFVHLAERECSIQRRHQKVIEECPSPINDTNLRRRMGEAALKVARAVNYVGAGTVEFLVDDVTREFYFLEMNTRLQVEHPVTELVTGIDMVREQILIANGEPLSFSQDEIKLSGHAIECRIYAEDPERDFLPSPGKIKSLTVPAGPGVRDDSGVSVGAEVSIFYDPMISKLAVWGRTRTQAIERLRRALDEYFVTGIKTNLTFFRQLVRDEDFVEARLDTGFIGRFFSRRSDYAVGSESANAPQSETELLDIAAIAAALNYKNQHDKASSRGIGLADGDVSHWRLAGRAAQVNAKSR